MTWNKEFEPAFHPKSVAMVGLSKDAVRGTQWSPARFITCYEELGFKGHIYPVNPKASEILDYKAYPSVASIPEPVDLVIISVKAPALPGVLEDCIRANAKNVHIFTAGLEETGEDEAKKLAIQVREIAARGGLRVIGPNCMGLYVPEAGIGFASGASNKAGPVAIVSQSGGHCIWFSQHGPDYGIYFSKVISYGNAYVLDCTDFLEYLATDEKTRIILMYLEGVNDGPKLLRLVREIRRSKPVIIWKAGLTDAGSRAVGSHTASLAGQQAVWQAFFTQTGATSVTSLQEMAEMAMTFLCIKPPQDNRAAVIGFGGGSSVAAADTCSREGLRVPALSQTTLDGLKALTLLAGAGITNPLDVARVFWDLTLLAKTIELVADDPNIDLLIMMPSLDELRSFGLEHVDKVVDYLSSLAISGVKGKPVVMVFHYFANDPWEKELRGRLTAELPKKGVAVYQSLTAASRTLARFIKYHQFSG
jgi:acyl-CoA synthetase (NDP forming)